MSGKGKSGSAKPNPQFHDDTTPQPRRTHARAGEAPKDNDLPPGDARLEALERFPDIMAVETLPDRLARHWMLGQLYGQPIAALELVSDIVGVRELGGRLIGDNVQHATVEPADAPAKNNEMLAVPAWALFQLANAWRQVTVKGAHTLDAAFQVPARGKQPLAGRLRVIRDKAGLAVQVAAVMQDHGLAVDRAVALVANRVGMEKSRIYEAFRLHREALKRSFPAVENAEAKRRSTKA